MTNVDNKRIVRRFIEEVVNTGHVERIAEDDWVVTQVTARGTHGGAWMGMTPTGRPVVITGVNVDRLVDGRIVEQGGAANLLVRPAPSPPLRPLRQGRGSRPRLVGSSAAHHRREPARRSGRGLVSRELPAHGDAGAAVMRGAAAACARGTIGASPPSLMENPWIEKPTGSSTNGSRSD